MTAPSNTPPHSGLLLCPFCGGEAYQPGLKVICSKCSASTVDYSMTMGKYEKEYAMARLVWNTRTPAVAVPDGYKLVPHPIKVKQTKLYGADGIHNGNCFAACLASMLGIELWMVPPFEDMFGRKTDDYYGRAMEWLNKFFSVELVRHEGHDFDNLPEFYMAIGKSKRGVFHQVIYRAGGLWHDPHPSNDGIESVMYCETLEPMAPATAGKQGD